VSHLFFDLDGTLTDPRDGIVRCLAHALATLNRPVPPESELSRFIGPPLARVFEILLGTTDDALVESAVRIYRERFVPTGMFENRVYPDVPSALAALVDRGSKLCLVTSKPAPYARRILDHFELARYFVAVHGPALDELKHTKSMLVARALAGESISPRAAVMIGDRKEDVEGAKANGVRSIGVLWGYGSRSELEAAGADEIVASMHDLLEVTR